MSELRSFERPGADSCSGREAIGHDLEALRSVTTQDQPGLETSLRAARRRASGETEEGYSMAIQFLKRRPALATALAVVVVAAGLLVIPISYERTVGYDVALTLEGATVAQSKVGEIARGLKEALKADGATVMASMENGRLSYVLNVSASGDVRESADAFATELKALGYTASVSTTPRRETIAGNVYAYAMSRVIEVSTDGKSAPELESEIRRRLAAAGVTQAQVSVTDLGDNQRAIKINAEHQAMDGAIHEEMPELVLTRDGKPLENACAVKVMKKKDGSGVTSLVVSVTVDGRTTTAEIANAESMGDAALAAEIQSRLLAAGFDAVVHVQGNEITVEKRKP